MKTTLILLAEYRQRFSLTGDFLKPRRWICFWFGHVEDVVPAMLSYHVKRTQDRGLIGKWEQVKSRIELPACKRCKRILDYTLNVGSPDGNMLIEQAQINIGTI